MTQRHLGMCKETGRDSNVRCRARRSYKLLRHCPYATLLSKIIFRKFRIVCGVGPSAAMYSRSFAPVAADSARWPYATPGHAQSESAAPNMNRCKFGFTRRSALRYQSALSYLRTGNAATFYVITSSGNCRRMAGGVKCIRRIVDFTESYLGCSWRCNKSRLTNPPHTQRAEIELF